MTEQTAGKSAAQQLARLAETMHRIRRDCPWDAEQTHRSLVKHLIEETAEVVEVIESDGQGAIDDADLIEELGDVLLQVFFHSEIAAQQGRFNIADVAAGVSDKLERRHPWVFAGQDNPEDMMGAWEAAKQAEKQRESALDGIPEPLPTLARANKVVSRARHVHLPVPMADEPIDAQTVGEQILTLVQRAQASGIDADQATRDAVRNLEAAIRDAESRA